MMLRFTRKHLMCVIPVVVSLLVGASIWNSFAIDATHHELGDVPMHPVQIPPRKHSASAVSVPMDLKLSSGPFLRNSTKPTLRQRNQQQHPIRILLGIESERVFDVNPLKRRRIVRKTYLDFDRLHRPDEPNRVCTMQEFFAAPQDYPHCRLIYTFLSGPKKSFKTKFSPGDVLPPEIFRNLTSEKDLIHFNLEVVDRVRKRWSWFRYVSSTLLRSNKKKKKNSDDIPLLVGYIDCQMLIQPSIFWDDNPLFQNTEDDALDPSLRLRRIYGGVPTSKTTCQRKELNYCASLVRETFMNHFVLLSTDLVDHLAKQPVPKLTDGTRDSPDVAIANGLASFPYPIQEVALRGLDSIPMKHPTSVYMEHFIYRYDLYKDQLTIYSDPVEEALVLSKLPSLRVKERKARLLLGIFSMDSPTELKRRETIRSTYLQAFVDSDTPHRICSIGELETMSVKQRDECEIAHVFVVGGNPDGPTEYVEETETTGPIVIPANKVPKSVRLPDHDKGDIAYLNIKENMEDGKSPTYFKYATTLLDKYYFDYMAKTDTDTIVYPEALLEKVIYKLPKFPDNVRVYAGHYAVHPTKEPQLGPAYMEGRFYMMSPDLARFITSRACNRTAVDTHIEDLSVGNFVHSLPKPIRRKGTVKKQGVFDHPVKDVEAFRSMWNASRLGAVEREPGDYDIDTTQR